MAASVRQFKVAETSASPGTATVTFDAPCVAGNTVLALVAWYGNTGANISTSSTVMDDDQSVNAYTFRESDERTSLTAAVGMWERANISGAVNSITFTPTLGSGVTYDLIGVELEGVATAPFDVSASSSGGGSSSSPATAASATLAQADNIVIAIEHHDTGSNLSITPTGGFSTVVEQENGSIQNTFNVASLVTSATTAVTATWTLGGSVQWAAALAVYKAATVSGVTGTAAWTEADDTVAASGTAPVHIWGEYVKEVGFVTNTTAGTTSAITVAAGGVPAGDVIVIYGACDNTGSGGAATTISAADNHAGTTNVYTLQTPQAIADPGSASAGQQGFMLVCPVTTALSAGDTITITYGNSTAAKAINAQQFHNVRIANTVLSGTYAHQDNQTSTTNSVAATATIVGQIVCALIAVEGGTADAFTEDNDTTGGPWVTLTRRGSGTTTGGSTLNSVYKLLRATGAQTYNPTLGTSRDHCAAILILDVPVQGPGAWTEEDDTLDASGSSGTTGEGTAAWTEADDVLAAVGTPTRKGTAAWTEASDTLAAAGSPTRKGTAAWTEADDVLAGVDVVVLIPASISGRKVLDQNGRVFLLRTFSSWGMAQQLSNADITTALEGVAGNGFNAVTVDMTGSIDHGTGWTRYTNTATSDDFWTGTAFQSSLGAAWASVDWIVSECARLGMCAVLSLFGGTGDGGTAGEGGKHDWLAATTTQMYNAGVAVATRYASATNIIWHLELDQADAPTDPPGVKAEAFFHGINDTEGASTRPLRWMEPANGTTADAQGWVGTTQLQAINTGYSYSGSSTVAAEGWYADNTSVPVGDCEPPYDGSPNYSTGVLGQQLRERSYAVFLEGGCLINYGHEDWWPFGGQGLYTEGLDWTDVQAHSHTVHQSYAWALLDEFVADTTWAPSAFVVTGEGTTDTKAAAGNSGRAAIAYFPNSRTIAVDTTLLTGTGNVRLRWYDPTTGSYTSIAASEAQSSSRSVTYPGNNAAGETDQVLVVDQPVSGTASWTEADDVLSAAGSTSTTGTAAWTEAADTLAAAGTSTHVATSAWTEASDTLAASGEVTHVATASWTEADDTLTAAGVGHTQSGSVSWTEADDAVAGAGAPTRVGTSAWTESNDTLAAIGSTGNEVGGPAAWTEADDSLSAAGKVTRIAAGAWTEADDSLAGAGQSTHVATGAWTEASDVLAAAGSSTTAGTATWTEADDLLAGAGAVTRLGVAAWTEADDILFAREAEAGPFAATSTGGHHLPSTSGGHLPPTTSGSHTL